MAVLRDRVVRDISSAFTTVLHKFFIVTMFPKILGGRSIAGLLYIMDGKNWPLKDLYALYKGGQLVPKKPLEVKL